jgi:hypothetical protein
MVLRAGRADASQWPRWPTFEPSQGEACSAVPPWAVKVEVGLAVPNRDSGGLASDRGARPKGGRP